MASLPAQHPHLALHLTDRALTPIISSGNPTSSSSSSAQQRQQRQLAALSALSTTALTAYDAAKRLEMGSPLRVVVEHPGDVDGPLVCQSFLCPMSLALGPTGRQRQRRGSDGSLDTAVTPTEGDGRHQLSAAPGVNGTSAAQGEGGSRQQQQQLGSAVVDDEDDEEEAGHDNDEEDGANHPPMLIGLVVAPSADDASEARRAAGRLERLARVFQTEWVAEQKRGDDRME